MPVEVSDAHCLTSVNTLCRYLHRNQINKNNDDDDDNNNNNNKDMIMLTTWNTVIINDVTQNKRHPIAQDNVRICHVDQ